MSLQIEAGKFYRDRKGDIRGPIKFDERLAPHAFFAAVNGGVMSWRQDGVWGSSGESYLDLVEEVPDPNAKIELNVANAFTRTKVRITADLGTATGIAARASELVGGDRDRQHGAKVDNFQRIATVWDAWLKVRKEPAAPLGPHDVGVMMVLMKMARTQSGALNVDDYIDAAGYAACAGEVAQAQTG